MDGLSPKDELIQKLEGELEQGARAGGIMKLGFAVQDELRKIEGREKTKVEAAIEEIVAEAIRALGRK